MKNTTPAQISPKNFWLVLINALALGALDAHRFAVGKWKSAILRLFTVGGLGIWLAIVPALAKAESFPVICTEAVPAANRINLEQLKDVPVPEIVQFGGLTLVNDAGREVTVTTWRKLTRCHKDGYWAKTNADIDMSDWFWGTRSHIPFLERAIPATNSFVRNLKPGKVLIRLLPLTIAPLLSEESDDVDNAIKHHKSWLEFYPNTKIIEQTDTKMSLRMGRSEMSVTILSYGDFNHDGFDDMLVFYDQGVTDGSFHYSGTAVLTRTTQDGALKLIE